MREVDAGRDLPGGFLLLPDGDGPWPAVIVLGGSEGGDLLARSRGPAFARRGYAALGLPYYSPRRHVPELPGAFSELPVEHVQRGLDRLVARSDVQRERIALYGFSKGAELALLAAWLTRPVAAVAAIAATDVVWEGWGPGVPPGSSSSFSWRGRPLPFVPYGGLPDRADGIGVGNAPADLLQAHEAGRSTHPAEAAAARIPVELITAAVLVAGGGADRTWPAARMAEAIARRRSAVGLATELHVFGTAGHHICGEGLNHVHGTEGSADDDAQRRLWPATLDFLHRHLRGHDARWPEG